MTSAPTRREFLKVATAGTVLSAGTNHAAVNASAAQFLTQASRGSYAAKSDGQIKLGNRHVEYGFDLASGALTYIESKASKRRLELPEEAAAPVRIWCGKRDGSDEVQAVISRSVPRSLSYVVSESEIGIALAFEWKDLLVGKESTGVAAACTFTLSADAGFVRVKTLLENRGHLWITGLFLGLEGIALSSNPESESLMVGDIPGKPYVNPRNGLKEAKAYVKIPAGKRSFSIPPTIPSSLVLSWMDLSDGRSGFGTGYLNRTEIDMVGHVESQPIGLALGWRLFRLEGSRGFMWGYTGEKQIYPLAPGEHFISDEMFLDLHEGDWHKTADVYRQLYQIAFKDDFLDWERTSIVVRNCDIMLNTFVAWGDPSKDPKQAYDYPRGHVINRFADITVAVDKALKALEAAPENIIVNILGTATEWGIYKMPDHFPMVKEAGGQEAAEVMCRQLRNSGVAGISMYAHTSFMHRQASNYIAAADTGMNYPHMDWHTSMGGIACIAAEEWYDLWTKKIYPQFAAMGVNALYFDEGFGHQFICRKPEHSHGSSAMGVLTAQARGATRLYRAWHASGGPSAYLCCEGGSDLQARWIDLWQFAPTEVLRYTHPDKMMKMGPEKADPRASVARAWMFGCPLLIAPLSTPWGPNQLEGELLDALRRFVALRRELRKIKAPGYPHRFRDNLGLNVPPDLKAKVYADPTGVTVAYFAPKSCDCEVVVNGIPLGLPEMKTQRRTLKAAQNEMGYLILPAK
jgi:hypothetical protein